MSALVNVWVPWNQRGLLADSLFCSTIKNREISVAQEIELLQQPGDSIIYDVMQPQDMYFPICLSPALRVVRPMWVIMQKAVIPPIRPSSSVSSSLHRPFPLFITLRSLLSKPPTNPVYQQTALLTYPFRSWSGHYSQLRPWLFAVK